MTNWIFEIDFCRLHTGSKNHVWNRQKIKLKNQFREIKVFKNQVQIDRGLALLISTWLLGDYLYMKLVWVWTITYSEDLMKLPVKQVWIRIRLGTWGSKFFFCSCSLRKKLIVFFFASRKICVGEQAGDWLTLIGMSYESKKNAHL